LRAAVFLFFLFFLFSSVASADRLDELGRLERETTLAALAERGLTIDPAPDGKTVRQLLIAAEPIFLRSDRGLTWLNFFHMTTRRSQLARDVLLRPGQRWDETLVEETRRNLRETGINNVVVLVPVQTNVPGLVDLLVVHRDLWSLRLNSNFELQQGFLSLLTVSLAEENFLGLRKHASFTFLMDAASWSVGPNYKDQNLAGTRLVLELRPRVVFGREDGRLEGTRAKIVFGYPLWSLAGRWAALVEVDHKDVFDRTYRGTGLATYDVPETVEEELIPRIYRDQTIDAAASVTRVFGGPVRHEVSVGPEYALARPSVSEAHFTGDDAARAAFERDVLPRSERSVAVFGRWRAFTPRYVRFTDLATFDLNEDIRLGPSVEVKLAQAMSALGSERDFTRTKLIAGWTSMAGGGLVKAEVGWTARLEDGALIDNHLQVSVAGATPIVAGLGRLLARLSVDALIEERSNRFFVLGGSNGLRGFEIGAFGGEQRLVGNVEVRTRPLKVWVVRAGALAFWDVGHAAGSWDELSLHHDVGIGLRLLIPQLNREVMRIDWAIPLSGPSAGFPGRLNIGFFQVF
jgi:hypothetical protein